MKSASLGTVKHDALRSNGNKAELCPPLTSSAGTPGMIVAGRAGYG